MFTERLCAQTHTHAHTHTSIFVFYCSHGAELDPFACLTTVLFSEKFICMNKMKIITIWYEHDNLHNTLVKIVNYLLKSCKPLQRAVYQTDNCSDRSDGSVTYPTSLEIMTDRPIGQPTNRGT